MKDNDIKIGVYICHCGSNIAQTVDVEKSVDDVASEPHVTVARDYKFMCAEPGQDLVIQDIKDLELNRVVVASCSPLMHEPTFRKACEKAGLNKYLFQMVNIREQCSWVHNDMASATEKATALIKAAENGHPETVAVLLENEAGVNARENMDRTALVHASANGHTEVIEILLKNRADVHAVDKSQQTALIWAALRGHAEAVKILLDARSDITAEDSNGWTALNWADSKGHTEVVELLEAAER